MILIDPETREVLIEVNADGLAWWLLKRLLGLGTRLRLLREVNDE